MITKLILFFSMSMMISYGKALDDSIHTWRIEGYKGDDKYFFIVPENSDSLAKISKHIVIKKENDPVAESRMAFFGHSAIFLIRHRDEFYRLHTYMFTKGVFHLTKLQSIIIHINGLILLKPIDDGIFFYDLNLHDSIMSNLESVKKYRERRIDHIKTKLNPNFKEPTYNRD